MISTDTAALIAKAEPLPSTSQKVRVSSDSTSTTGTKTADIRSASF